ncbi:MBL fold metallo-hydrolase [Mycolicibacterium senegalense]|uniref:MBL fold metallo-hydrolase n=1 Tax=Mycolicibacterium senegalense TaxID=1796 RepID=UPI003AAEE7CA
MLTSTADNHVLIDGGPTGPLFERSVGETLRDIRRQRRNLDLVVVTHIDDDHIDGIIRLLELQTPRSQVPSIAALWHNSWPAPVSRSRSDGPGARLKPPQSHPIHEYASLVMAAVDASVEQAGQLSDQARKMRRPIKRNNGFRGGPVRLSSPLHIRHVDSAMNLTVLWPNESALTELKAVFDRHHNPGTSTRRKPKPFLRSATAERKELRNDIDVMLGIGDNDKITRTNRASIILLANETQPGHPTRSCLLTGDAAADDILDGLTAAGKFRRRATFHCDVLKLQHHGAKDNFSTEIAQAIVAEHYVISANGQHNNPEPEVLRHLIEQRAGSTPQRDFTLWFTCDPQRAPASSRSAMRDALTAATTAARAVNSASDATVRVNLLKPSENYFDICLCPPTPRRKCNCMPAGQTTTSLID